MYIIGRQVGRLYVFSKQVGRYIHIRTYVLLNGLYVYLVSNIRTLCNYNVIILVACATKHIYKLVKKYKDIMKNQPIGKMKQVIVATQLKDQNPSKFEKQSHKQPFVLVSNIQSHIVTTLFLLMYLQPITPCWIMCCCWKVEIVRHGRTMCVIVCHVIFLVWMAKLIHPRQLSL